MRTPLLVPDDTDDTQDRRWVPYRDIIGPAVKLVPTAQEARLLSQLTFGEYKLPPLPIMLDYSIAWPAGEKEREVILLTWELATLSTASMVEVIFVREPAEHPVPTEIRDTPPEAGMVPTEELDLPPVDELLEEEPED